MRTPRSRFRGVLGVRSAAFPRTRGEAWDARRAPGMGSAWRSDLPADHASGRGGYGRAPGYGLLVRLFFLSVSDDLVFVGHKLRVGDRSGLDVSGIVSSGVRS